MFEWDEEFVLTEIEPFLAFVTVVKESPLAVFAFWYVRSGIRSVVLYVEIVCEFTGLI